MLPTEPFQYGDWLDPDAPGDRRGRRRSRATSWRTRSTSHSARLLARAERLVGDADRAEPTYDALADRVAAATFERWGDDAVDDPDRRGARARVRPRARPSAATRIADGLAENVRRENGRIATGFLGTPLVLFALSRTGHLDEAYLMLLRREAPSWLYQVDRGATTVWERWDAILPDGSIHSGAMEHPSEERPREAACSRSTTTPTAR